MTGFKWFGSNVRLILSEADLMKSCAYWRHVLWVFFFVLGRSFVGIVLRGSDLMWGLVLFGDGPIEGRSSVELVFCEFSLW